MDIKQQIFSYKQIMVLTIIGFFSLFSLELYAATDDSHLTDAVSNDIRLEKDVARDINRKPANILAFAGVKEGHTVIDMLSGGGYYSELFSLSVGKSGSVYILMSRADDARVAMFENMTKINDRNLADMKGRADLIFTALNYHDIVNSDKFDRPDMLAGIKSHLKDDGVFVIIDHAAAQDSGKSATNTLHRIDKDFVIAEVTSAGFILDDESFDLKNDQDGHNLKVFDPAIRGRTDRFVLRFKKATQVVTN